MYPVAATCMAAPTATTTSRAMVGHSMNARFVRSVQPAARITAQAASPATTPEAANTSGNGRSTSYHPIEPHHRPSRPCDIQFQ